MRLRFTFREGDYTRVGGLLNDGNHSRGRVLDLDSLDTQLGAMGKGVSVTADSKILQDVRCPSHPESSLFFDEQTGIWLCEDHLGSIVIIRINA